MLKDGAELHRMSNASNVGYGAVTYVKIFPSDQKEVLVAMFTSKSCVAPLNQVTSGIHGSILRLESMAAVVLAKRQPSYVVRCRSSSQEKFFGWTSRYYCTRSRIEQPGRKRLWQIRYRIYMN